MMNLAPTAAGWTSPTGRILGRGRSDRGLGASGVGAPRAPTQLRGLQRLRSDAPEQSRGGGVTRAATSLQRRRALHSRALIRHRKSVPEVRCADDAEGGAGSPSSAAAMALRARHETRREGLRDAATCAAVRPRGRLREPPRRGCEQLASRPGLALLDGLCTRRQHVRFRVHSPSPTFRGLRVDLCTARATRPSDSGLCTEGLCPPVSPDHNSSCDPDSSLKLRMQGPREKGIRGGDAELRFQSASRPGNLLVGRHSRHLFGRP